MRRHLNRRKPLRRKAPKAAAVMCASRPRRSVFPRPGQPLVPRAPSLEPNDRAALTKCGGTAVVDPQEVQGKKFGSMALCQSCIDEQPTSSDWKVCSLQIEGCCSVVRHSFSHLSRVLRLWFCTWGSGLTLGGPGCQCPCSPPCGNIDLICALTCRVPQVWQDWKVRRATGAAH